MRPPTRGRSRPGAKPWRSWPTVSIARIHRQHAGCAPASRPRAASPPNCRVARGRNAQHFPLRNRLVAGMVRGVVVVEAPLKSGALITARLGLDYNREVMAVPGPVESRQSRGCHALIRQGAVLVTSTADVLDLLLPPGPPVGRAGAGDGGRGGRAGRRGGALALGTDRSRRHRARGAAGPLARHRRCAGRGAAHAGTRAADPAIAGRTRGP